MNAYYISILHKSMKIQSQSWSDFGELAFSTT